MVFLGGVRNKATLVTMGREIFNPGSTGNKAAEELARAWIETAETARECLMMLVVEYLN